MAAVLARFRAAVASDLVVLARLHDRELTPDDMRNLRDDGFPGSLAFRLETPVGRSAKGILATAVGRFGGEAMACEELAADYAAIYLNHAYRVSPCESVWLDEEGLAMQGPMFEVRAAFARHGLQAPNWRKRPDDHLVHQLQFVAELLGHDSRADLAEAARFLDEHLLRWVSEFARRVSTRAGTAFYAGLALLTAAYLDELRQVLARVLGEPRPTSDEIERRMRRSKAVALADSAAFVPGAAPSW